MQQVPHTDISVAASALRENALLVQADSHFDLIADYSDLKAESLVSGKNNSVTQMVGMGRTVTFFTKNGIIPYFFKGKNSQEEFLPVSHIPESYLKM